MYVDAMASALPLPRMQELARDTERAGYSGLVLTEGGRTAYLSAAAAALATERISIATGVAVAFPRSPMVTAQCAWELADASEGRFRLGLGTQVRTHIVRRYGAAFDQPGPRLEEYVTTVRSIFASFRGAPLDVHGKFHELTFMNPQWSAGPIAADDPPVDVAAVNPWMLRMAGRVADGVHIHPIGEPGYLRRHAMVELAAGAAAVGRSIDEVTRIVPVITIVGSTDEEVATSREQARAQVAFYASTPNYAFILEGAGFDGLSQRIREKQKGGDIDGMVAQVTDEALAVFACEASWDGLAAALVERYDGLADRLVLYMAGPAWIRGDVETFARFGEVAQQIGAMTL